MAANGGQNRALAGYWLLERERLPGYCVMILSGWVIR